MTMEQIKSKIRLMRLLTKSLTTMKLLLKLKTNLLKSWSVELITQKELNQKLEFEAFKRWQKRNPKRWRNIKKVRK